MTLNHYGFASLTPERTKAGFGSDDSPSKKATKIIDISSSPVVASSTVLAKRVPTYVRVGTSLQHNN